MKILFVFNNYMPETGGYQSANQMFSEASELFGKENVTKIFLTAPKRNLTRIRLFLKLLIHERAYNAEGMYCLNDNGGRITFLYNIFKVFNYFQISKSKKALKKADYVVITGFLKFSIICEIQIQAKSSKLFFNHAGDPITYNTIIRSGDKSLEWEGYLAYMKNFSKVLFQSELQLNFAVEIGLDSVRCFNLLPTCNEDLIIDELIGASNPFNSEFCNIVNVGTLQERKNQELIIDVAFNLRHLPFRFYLIGDKEVSPSYTDKLQKIISDRNLNNVFILGHRTDYIVFVNYSDVVINVSKFEGVSRVLRESLFLGKILLCTKIFGNVECVIDGENGFLCGFECRDLIEKLSFIRELGADKKTEFEMRSKLIYKEKYNLGHYRNNLRILYPA